MSELADARLQELRRFAELGRTSASLLHELSNPLTAALLHLELSDQRSVSVRRARRNIKLLRSYVEAARQQMRRQSRTTRFWIEPQIRSLKPVLLPLARKASVRLDIKPPPDCQLYGDPVKFQHIIANLVTNAIEAYVGVAMPKEPLVRVIWRLYDGQLIIQVSDWGAGISPEILPHLFETFYSTKARSGLGLGLAIVKHYVTEDFDGSITVTSPRQGGTCFTVRLPNTPQ